MGRRLLHLVLFAGLALSRTAIASEDGQRSVVDSTLSTPGAPAADYASFVSQFLTFELPLMPTRPTRIVLNDIESVLCEVKKVSW